MDIITQMKPQEVLMPATVEFTVDQIVELFSRLPDSERQAALSIIRQKERERRLARAIQQVADDARHLARERGLDWDALSQPEREELEWQIRARNAGRLLDELDATGNREELTPAIEAEIIAEVNAVRAERKRRNAGSA